MRFIDLTGDRFGRLTVLSRAPNMVDSQSRVAWLCGCECGAEVIVSGGHLRSGDTRSCGCLLREVTGDRARRHGDSKRAAEYDCWLNIKRRCYDPKNNSWDDYGGRGITVCERWLDSYQSFLADMGRRPSPAHSIDRKNNDGNYEPDNCKWSTRKEQANNRRPPLKVVG